MRRKVVCVVLAIACVFLRSASTAQTGVPVTPSQMTLACQLGEGDPQWHATLAYPGQGGFGWRCYDTSNPVTHYHDVDIEGLCLLVYRLHAHGGSTPYNWRCDR
jgi:hypothetical protein